MNLTQWTEGVNVTFKKLVYKILEHIKNKPYFWWPGRWAGTQLEGIRACTALIIKRKVILLSNVV